MQIEIPNMNGIEDAVKYGQPLYGVYIETVVEVLNPDFGYISKERDTTLMDIIAEEDIFEKRVSNKNAYDVLLCYADPSEAFSIAGKAEDVKRDLDVSKHTTGSVHIGLDVVPIQRADDEFSVQGADSIELGQGQRLYISPQGEYMIKQGINRTSRRTKKGSR